MVDEAQRNYIVLISVLICVGGICILYLLNDGRFYINTFTPMQTFKCQQKSSLDSGNSSKINYILYDFLILRKDMRILSEFSIMHN